MLEAVYCNFLLTIQGSVSSSDLYPISYCICPDFFYLLGKNCWPESSISTISMIFGINLHLGFVLTHQSSISAFYLWRENQFLPSKFIHIYIIYLIFCCCTRSLLPHTGFSLAAVNRGYSSFQHVGLSSWWRLLLQRTGSKHEGFSSCSRRAQ